MAVQVLDHLGGSEALSALMGILADEREQTVVEVVCPYYLFSRRMPTGRERYTARLPIRALVATHLGHMGDARASEALALATGDSNVHVAQLACEALGHIGGERSVEVLRRCMKEKRLRGVAWRALRDTGDRAMADRLLGNYEYLDRRMIGVAGQVNPGR